MLLAKVAIHDKYFREKAKQLAGVDGDDLVQEMYLKLHRYNQSKLKEMIQNEVVKYLGVRIINQIFIDGKRKQKEYCGGVPEIKVEEKEQDERITKAKEIVKNQHWYDQKIFNLYIEENYTMRELAAETGIPLCEIWATINRVKKTVKQEL